MIDISKEGYELSSELFSFKDIRRGIIEHGKTCYIEGYKRHLDLFANFLIKNGYFSKEEYHKISAEFEESLKSNHPISVDYISELMSEIHYSIPKNNLYPAQKDIIELYLKNEDLYIQKPRQAGVSSVLKAIAYAEALQEKNVLYLGYDIDSKNNKRIKNTQYLTKKRITSGIIYGILVGKRYDLIIVDEISTLIDFRIDILKMSLNEGGHIIIVCNPSKKSSIWQKKIFMTFNTGLRLDGGEMYYTNTQGIIYKIKPLDKNIEISKTYPDAENELLGVFTS